MRAQSLESCLTLWDLLDRHLSSSSVHEILQEIYAYFVPTSYLQEITLIYCEYIQRCMKISFELVLIIVYYYVQFRQLF